MPHSSGGGSHGGGSHGGSHSSSAHSSSGSAVRISKSYFSGARTFVRYRNGGPEYVYANCDMTKKASKLRLALTTVLLLLFCLPFVFSGSSILKEAIGNPKKITSSYDNSIVIEDRAGVIENETELRKSLNAFLSETGIAPAVITVHNDEWKGNYSNLENYAFDLYVNRFSDENHWLIVYSQPVSVNPTFNDWYWEGMQGDNTDSVINERLLGVFNKTMQKSLMDNRVSVDTAIKTAFDEVTPTAMESNHGSQNLSEILPAVFFIVFPVCIVGVMIAIPFINEKKKEGLTEISPAQQMSEATCEYCGGIYLVGTCLNCPHCGASLPPRQ